MRSLLTDNADAALGQALIKVVKQLGLDCLGPELSHSAMATRRKIYPIGLCAASSAIGANSRLNTQNFDKRKALPLALENKSLVEASRTSISGRLRAIVPVSR
jgi:hypothetical protein